MSAEILRRAAALMRERAEVATPGTWNHDREPGIGHVIDTRASMIVVGDQEGDREDAEHIASWHPAVALAVADLLDAQAKFMEDGGDFSDIEGGGDASTLAVARAYLAESA